MKEILYLTFLIHLSVSYNIAIPEDNRNQCLRITILRGEHVTMLLDTDNNTDVMLKTCLLKNIHKDQTLLLLNRVLNDSPIRQTMSFKRNLVVITKTLSHEFLHNILSTAIISSHSNLLYIIVTDKTKFICDNGKLNQFTFTQAQNFLNNLWQKHQIIRVVLIFLYTCPDNTYVIYDGKKQSNSELYDRTIKLIKPKTFKELSTAIDNSGLGLTQGYPLKANIFDRFPTSIMSCDKINQYYKWNPIISNGFCGLDGLVLQETVNHFQFNVSFPKDGNCSGFGYMDLDSGVITGSLGCVLQRKIDISFNSRFMVAYAKDKFYYLYYIAQDSLCILLPIPELVPLWYYPFHMLRCSSLSLFISTPIALTVISWFTYTLKYKRSEKKPLKIHDHFFDYVTCVLFGFSTKKHSKFYLLRGVCLIGSIIISTKYQGYINYSFTNLIRYNRIVTLKELYASKTILHTSVSINELLKTLETSNDQMQAIFFERARLYERSDIDVVLKSENRATVSRKLDAKLEILLRYTDIHKTPLMYVLDDCFRTYYLSYIARNGFPFIKRLKVFMERLLQAGLPKIYYKWTQRSLNVHDTFPKDYSEPRPPKALNMKDQRVPFVILLIGYIISSTVFIAEKWLAKRNIRNIMNSS